MLLKKVRQQVGEKGWKAGDVRKIKHDIEEGFGKMLNLLSIVAFAAMAVAALGVTNTVMASVRSRQWQFGILRSIGVTHNQLLRLVIAEALLLGVIGVAVGDGGGISHVGERDDDEPRNCRHVPPLSIPLGTHFAGDVHYHGDFAAGESLARPRPCRDTQTLTLLQSGRGDVSAAKTTSRFPLPARRSLAADCWGGQESPCGSARFRGISSGLAAWLSFLLQKPCRGFGSRGNMLFKEFGDLLRSDRFHAAYRFAGLIHHEDGLGLHQLRESAQIDILRIHFIGDFKGPFAQWPDP